MTAEAVPLGERLIAAEATLDRQFADRSATPASLAATTEAIGAAQATLRATHLRYYLVMMDVLTPEQVAFYLLLRGREGGPAAGDRGEPLSWLNARTKPRPSPNSGSATTRLATAAPPMQPGPAMPAPDPFPTLDTARLRLRCAEPADAAAISALMTEGISRWLGNWPMPYTPGMAAERIRDWGDLVRARRGMPCVITDRWSSELLGWIHCVCFADPALASMGYWCGEAFQGRGYVREAAAALVPAAFRFLRAEAIEAVAQPANAGSLAVMRGLGMRPMGETTSFAAARAREETVLRFRLDRPAAAVPAG